MEQMIIAMIYLYPSALVDILRRVFLSVPIGTKKQTTAHEQQSAVFSTMISVGLLIYGRRGSVANPADLLNTFQPRWRLRVFVR
ncbi:MAG: hypothetical protein ACLUMK_13890 [Christensenellales bacterium]